MEARRKAPEFTIMEEQPGNGAMVLSILQNLAGLVHDIPEGTRRRIARLAGRINHRQHI
jgi:hypothetical protein